MLHDVAVDNVTDADDQRWVCRGETWMRLEAG